MFIGDRNVAHNMNQQCTLRDRAHVSRPRRGGIEWNYKVTPHMSANCSMTSTMEVVSTSDFTTARLNWLKITQIWQIFVAAAVASGWTRTVSCFSVSTNDSLHCVQHVPQTMTIWTPFWIYRMSHEHFHIQTSALKLDIQILKYQFTT